MFILKEEEEEEILYVHSACSDLNSSKMRFVHSGCIDSNSLEPLSIWKEMMGRHAHLHWEVKAR